MRARTSCLRCFWRVMTGSSSSAGRRDPARPSPRREKRIGVWCPVPEDIIPFTRWAGGAGAGEGSGVGNASGDSRGRLATGQDGGRRYGGKGFRGRTSNYRAGPTIFSPWVPGSHPHSSGRLNDTLRDQLQADLGQRLRITGELGGGGMSRVFVADDLALGRRVVVKVLAPEMAAGVNVERFRREILLAASLQHPHIVPVLTAGAVADSAGHPAALPHFTMPFIEGDSLRARLTRDAKLS